MFMFNTSCLLESRPWRRWEANVSFSYPGLKLVAVTQPHTAQRQQYQRLHRWSSLRWRGGYLFSWRAGLFPTAAVAGFATRAATVGCHLGRVLLRGTQERRTGLVYAIACIEMNKMKCDFPLWYYFLLITVVCEILDYLTLLGLQYGPITVWTLNYIVTLLHYCNIIQFLFLLLMVLLQDGNFPCVINKESVYLHSMASSFLYEIPF